MNADKRGHMGGISVSRRLSAVQTGRYIHRLFVGTDRLFTRREL
jgi:hypothetical protein